MDIFVAVLAWQVADLQAAATLVSLPADGQRMGSTATGIASLIVRRVPLLTATLEYYSIKYSTEYWSNKTTRQ